MAGTLKQQYDAKNLLRLREQVKKADRQVLVETRTTRLILEAMNEEDLKKATQIIDKLRGLKGKGLASLDTAIDAAITELNKYTGGGAIAQAWTKLKSRVGIDNPLVKVMTFANALETGFKQVPTVLKNNLGEIKPDMAKKTLDELLADKQDAKKVVTQNLLKALTPKGVFGAFKKVPYIQDMKMFVADMLSTPLENLNTVVKQTAGGPQTDQIAADIKGSVTDQGGAETKGAQPADASKGSAPTTGTAPSKETSKTNGTTPTGETPPRTNSARTAGGGGDVKAKVMARAKPALEDMGIKDIDRLLSTLEDLGVLKAPG